MSLVTDDIYTAGLTVGRIVEEYTSKVTLHIPARVKVGEDITIEGSVFYFSRSGTSLPIVGEEVAILVDNEEVTRVTTNGNGEFLVTIVIDKPGYYEIKAVYGGNAEKGISGSEASGRIRVEGLFAPKINTWMILLLVVAILGTAGAIWVTFRR